ncbi:hypothetical protein VP01_1080g4 [Puccinia sorghi]|uniref:Uncharacterized protein n=1 Tax=Puccinia sorghi TaxID=27349 RepID=A0A0L6VUS0_9BASI|nr:hypothetical protein VP01_1080g4 [Puccinia sorghi]
MSAMSWESFDQILGVVFPRPYKFTTSAVRHHTIALMHHDSLGLCLTWGKVEQKSSQTAPASKSTIPAHSGKKEEDTFKKWLRLITRQHGQKEYIGMRKSALRDDDVERVFQELNADYFLSLPDRVGEQRGVVAKLRKREMIIMEAEFVSISKRENAVRCGGPAAVITTRDVRKREAMINPSADTIDNTITACSEFRQPRVTPVTRRGQRLHFCDQGKHCIHNKNPRNRVNDPCQYDMRREVHCIIYKEIRGKQESHDERLGLFHRRWSGNDRHGNYSMAGNMIAGRTAPDMWDAIRKKADALQYKGLPMSLICFNASLGLGSSGVRKPQPETSHSFRRFPADDVAVEAYVTHTTSKGEDFTLRLSPCIKLNVKSDDVLQNKWKYKLGSRKSGASYSMLIG